MKTRSNLPSLTFTAGIAALALGLSSCGSGNSGGPAEPANAEAASTVDQALHDALPDSIRSSGKLRIGATTVNPPYSSKTSGEMEGLVPELAEEVGEVLGVEVAFEGMPFTGLIPALQADRIDVIWSIMVDTVEREKTLDFVSYLGNTSAFLVYEGNPEQIEEVADLCGVDIALVRGTLQVPVVEKQKEACAAAGKADVNILIYDDTAAAQTQMRAGKADAFFGGGVALRSLAAKVDNGNTFDVVGNISVGADVLAIGMPKDEGDLAQTLQSALKKVVEDGTYDEILTKYHADEDAFTADEILINPVGEGTLK